MFGPGLQVKMLTSIYGHNYFSLDRSLASGPKFWSSSWSRCRGFGLVIFTSLVYVMIQIQLMAMAQDRTKAFFLVSRFRYRQIKRSTSHTGRPVRYPANDVDPVCTRHGREY